MHVRSWRVILLTILSIAWYRPACAQSGTVQEGKRLPVISATAASGVWLQRAAFDRTTYGKVRGVCPGASPEPKIAIYTGTLSKEFFNIAVAVDNYLADHPELAWSFVQVQDKKGAQAGGYTADELSARLDEIKSLAQQNGIKHLSFLIAAPGSNDPEASKNVLMAHVKPANQGFPTVDWVSETPIALLHGLALSNYIFYLDRALRIKDNPAPPIFVVIRIKAGETGSLEMAIPDALFRSGGGTGRDFLFARRTDLTLGGAPTSIRANNATIPGVPGLDVSWDNNQPMIKFHAHPDTTAGTYDLVFTYQGFGYGTFSTGIRVVISAHADGKAKKN